ncbi:hypothetical protein HZD82_27395, partial [Pantoea agglomerans]|uniref:hypothetical protein n=1 Tax=Enterobacter agglomerans TaxID=549 RepID=UPI001A8E7198
VQRMIPVTLGGEERWAIIEDAARLRDALAVVLPDDLPETFAAVQRMIPVTLGGEERWAIIEDAARLRDALAVVLPDDLP